MTTLWENTAFYGAAASIFLWAITRIFQFFQGQARHRAEHRNVVRALFSEIDFNTKDLYFFLHNSRDLSKLEAALKKDKALIPHVTDAHHTLIYRQNIDKLHHIDDTLVTRLVHFYGLLDKIKEQIDGLNLPSFQTVSTEAKLRTVRRIVLNVEECEEIGVDILNRFKKAHTWLTLTRDFRPLPAQQRKTGF